MPTIQVPRLERDVAIRSETFNPDEYTVDCIFTTGARGRQFSWADGPYDEELVVTPRSVRLERLNAGAPFLNVHNRYELRAVIGSVVPGTAKIVKGEGLATVKLSRREECAGIVQDIRDQIIRSISCGYRYHKVEKTEGEDGIPLWRATDWEPLELSAVPIPVDPGARMRSEGPGAPTLYPCLLIGGEASAAGAARARMRMRQRALGLS